MTIFTFSQPTQLLNLKFSYTYQSNTPSYNVFLDSFELLSLFCDSNTACLSVKLELHCWNRSFSPLYLVGLCCQLSQQLVFWTLLLKNVAPNSPTRNSLYCGGGFSSDISSLIGPYSVGGAKRPLKKHTNEILDLTFFTIPL